MSYLQSSDGPQIIAALVATIRENRAYLSELDGAVGDGDHGINMTRASPWPMSSWAMAAMISAKAWRPWARPS
jgi:hypothetical protein